MQYYERLRELREKNKLTQQKIAMDLGVSQKAISQYEINKRKPSPEMLIKFAKYYNISLDYLLCLIDEPRPLK